MWQHMTHEVVYIHLGRHLLDAVKCKVLVHKMA
jgi:hypothetical protein